MVCIPCIIAPVLLFIWYRFIQPIVLKFWNPWAPKTTIQDTSDSTISKTIDANVAACPFFKKSEVKASSNETEQGDKKTD